jgi:predicted nucleotidyltransferase
MVSKKTSEPLLQTMVQRLLAAGQPQKIILFGSQARGQAGRDSDYDLLVIEDSSQPRYRRAAPYRRALKDLGTSKDILVWTPREIAEWKNVPNAFITTALREGRVLYERQPLPGAWLPGLSRK